MKIILPVTGFLSLSVYAITVFPANHVYEKPIVVTATRTAQTTDGTLAAVTVITRQEIERLQTRSIEDLFRGLPGISIANSGGPGKLTTVFMRGTESDHVQVLIDGIRVGSATSGTTSFENIPIEQIERIEIVRGPRSSLYGSEAIGGVIQIFTRKGERGRKLSLSLGGGSYGTLNGSANLSMGNAQGWLNLGLSGIGTAGFNACRGSAISGCFNSAPDQDKDGYRNVSGTAQAGYRFASGLEIAANFLHAAGKTEFDGSPFFALNKSLIAQQVFGGSASFSPLDAWRIKLTTGRSRENLDSFEDKIFKSRFNTQRDTVLLQNDLALFTNQLTTLGGDYQHDHVDSTTRYTVSSRYNWGIFAQHQAVLSRHNLQGSLRLDNNQQFGRHVTGGIAWGYALTDSMRLTANFGNAFKAPTFNELYFPNFSNAELQPEKSHSVELGAKGNTGWGSWSLNLYETRIKDLISFNLATGGIDNVNQARIRGAEGVLTILIKGWHVNMNLTLLDPVDRSAGFNQGNILARRARQSFRLDTYRIFGKFMAGALLLAEGRRYDDPGNMSELDGYAKADLRAEYQINSHWRLQGRIENIFDKQYETAAFFNQPGRNFFATLRYQP